MHRVSTNKRRQSGVHPGWRFLLVEFFLIWLKRQMFDNRDDATARRLIWLRQMRDVERRKDVRSTDNVAPSRRRGYHKKQLSCEKISITKNSFLAKSFSQIKIKKLSFL